jgi:hypothetical protein
MVAPNRQNFAQSTIPTFFGFLPAPGTAGSFIFDSYLKGGAWSKCVDELSDGSIIPPGKRENPTEGKTMKKLLLLPLIAIGLALIPAKQADAQVSVGIGGVGIGFGYPAYRYGYYGYPGYGYGYYPRSYYSYYGGSPYYRTYYNTGRPYYYSSHRKHHRHYYYRH